jgi:predicted phage baseplate assembly protein
VQWHEVPTLLGYGPRDRVFVTRTGADGRTVVRFGDGQTGARLPTGPENVRATYRKGVGREGIVAAGQLSLPLTRPLGLRGVGNPEPSADAADPEPLEEARHNAPLAVRSLGRVVSLRDYEDFARAYAGVAKAAAARERGAKAPAVVVTVAGAGGAPVPAGGALHLNLLAALRQAGDPQVAVRVRSYQPVSFRIAAGITVEPDHQAGSVLAAVKDALRARFGFAARGLGQSVTLGEVIAAIQAVPGVVAVDVDRLERVPPTGAARGPGARLAAADVELLTLELGPLDGIEVRP